MKLQPRTRRKLASLRVEIDALDEDTMVLRNVPVHELFFNKDRTNLLIKRAPGGQPLLICVDRDLEYLGQDPVLLRRFAGAPKQDGWCVLLVEPSAAADAETLVERALTTLGANGEPPAAPAGDASQTAAQGGRLLAVFGRELSQMDKSVRFQTCVGREAEIDDAASCLLRWGEARLAAVTGPAGTGKTNLLWAVAKRLSACQPETRVWLVDLAHVFSGTLFESERAGLLQRILAETIESPNTVLAMEHLELAATDVRHGALALTRALDHGARLAGTILPSQRGWLDKEPLGRRVTYVDLAETDSKDSLAILHALRDTIAAHHRVEIDPACLLVCLAAAESMEGCFPGKAITLLDNAAARASLAAAQVVGPEDLYFAAGRCNIRAED